ncbi:MAG: hypothetical protein HC908_06500 [Calothrix sp. SM1_7_51]|nr:hypothetical protein [Calothrix sp. SM1_7_51]
MAAIAITTLLCSYTAQIPVVTATTKQVSYRQQGWETVLHVARMRTNNQLVLQMDVQNKPVTSYANAVYMVYARHNQKWVQVYTSRGARLIASQSRRVLLEPEIINLSDIQSRLGQQVDLSELEFKTVAMLRYDVRGRRDQVVQFEQLQRYSSIAETNTVQIANTQSVPVVVNTPVAVNPVVNTVTQSQSRFSLSILQKQPRLSQVIARVSLKQKQGNSFSSEQLIGDFRYKLKKYTTAQFLQGVELGDRVVVRLFANNKKLIGYSEFEVLTNNSTVTLVLPEQAKNDGIVRTVYGIDSNRDNRIDPGRKVYDYFTQVSQKNRFQDATVRFFNSSQSINARQFELAGIPAPKERCVYPSFIPKR